MGCFGCVVCSFALIVGVEFVFCYSDIWFGGGLMVLLICVFACCGLLLGCVCFMV